jgi:hypothetical protein
MVPAGEAWQAKGTNGIIRAGRESASQVQRNRLRRRRADRASSVDEDGWE